jgi:predicted nucleotidyltransferase
MAAFEYRNAEDVRDVFKRHGVKYLFFGKSGAILLGFSDTTQDVDVFVEKHAANCEQLATALSDLGFRLTEQQTQRDSPGKGFHST